MNKVISFDFDGVIHSYTSGWKGADVIPDFPVKGIKKVLEELKAKDYVIGIVSSRAIIIEGKAAIEKYMARYELPYDFVTSEKVPSIVLVDDRTISFDGDTSTLVEKIEAFKPWYAKEETK